MKFTLTSCTRSSAVHTYQQNWKMTNKGGGGVTPFSCVHPLEKLHKKGVYPCLACHTCEAIDKACSPREDGASFVSKECDRPLNTLLYFREPKFSKAAAVMTPPKKHNVFGQISQGAWIIQPTLSGALESSGHKSNRMSLCPTINKKKKDFP